MTRKEAYILAIQNEIKSQNLYTAMAKSFGKSEMATTLLSLVPLEKNHEEKLRLLFAKEFPNEVIEVDPKLTPKFGYAEIVNDPQALFEFAISREDLAQNGYLQLASGSTDAEVKVLFENFANEELQHKELLESEIQRINGLMSWYDPSELTGLVED